MKILIKKSWMIILSVLLAAILFGCGKSVTYTVTFDSFGGTPVESQKVKEGKQATEPEEPTKEGFTFVEWQYKNSKYDFDTIVTQDITLTAFYSINEGTEVVSVALNADNGNGVETVNIAKGSTMSEPPKPTKEGFTFKGWYYEDKKFDFSTKINENILLVAKWSEEKQTKSDDKGKESNSNKKSNNSEKEASDSNTSSGEQTTSKGMIKFSDVEGVWYGEGHDDLTLTFSVQGGTWVYLESVGFDYYTGEVSVNTGRGGTEYFYDNGKFYSEEIKLSGTTKLTYTKNNKSMVFYRQKNYPKEQFWPYEKLLNAINGYYWYLDGYEYTYLHPSIIPWDNHECLSWESLNISVKKNKLVAFENFEPSAYKQYGSASADTHNTLMVNPTQYADSLIQDFNMRVQSNKMYMTVGGKEYSFTRYKEQKPIKMTLEVDNTNIVATAGDKIKVNASISPWWNTHSVSASSTGAVTGSTSGAASSDGNLSFQFYAASVGQGNITLKENKSGITKTINVTVNPLKVSGVSINQSAIEIQKGDTKTLSATVMPTNASEKGVTWSTSNANIATVSSSGKIVAKGLGTAVVTVTTKDGNYTASCTVTVKPLPLAVKASIGTEIRFVSGGVAQGVKVNVTANGGSESYVSYHIKLFYNGELVGEASEKEMFVTPIRNGSYTAEVYVKDSSNNEATTITTTTISL